MPTDSSNSLIQSTASNLPTYYMYLPTTGGSSQSIGKAAMQFPMWGFFFVFGVCPPQPHLVKWTKVYLLIEGGLGMRFNSLQSSSFW